MRIGEAVELVAAWANWAWVGGLCFQGCAVSKRQTLCCTVAKPPSQGTPAQTSAAAPVLPEQQHPPTVQPLSAAVLLDPTGASSMPLLCLFHLYDVWTDDL
jgi:hypothetical protein